MSTVFEAAVSSKGQVVIPKPLRDRFGITEGAVIAFAEDGRGLRLHVRNRVTPEAIAQSLAAGAGLADYQGPALTTTDMRRHLRARFAGKKQA